MRARALPFVLSILAGCLYAGAFPGAYSWPLAFFAFVPVLFALERISLTTKGAIAFGALFGFVVQIISLHWLVPTLVKFAGFPLAACIAIVVLFCLIQGGQLALIFYLLHRAKIRGLPPSWVAAPAVAAGELFYPHVFPSYFGSTLHELTTAIQIADLGGPILLSALLVLLNAAVYEVLVARTWRRTDLRFCAVAVVVWGAALAYGTYRIANLEDRVARAETLDAALVQANIGTTEKHEDPGRTYRQYLQQSVELENQFRPDLIVWPENVTGIVTSPKRKLGPLNAALLFGGVEVDQKTKALYNAAFLVGPSLESGPYRKHYLLPFGEYLPLGDRFPALYELSTNSSRFTPGTDKTPLQLGSRRIGVIICYEDILPAFVRGMVRDADPELIVNVTDDAWFGDTAEPWMHLALSKFRAVEHHRYLLRATSTGVSAVIDPVGRIVARSGVFEPAVLHATVRWLGGQTLYAKLGDWPGWLGVFAVAWFLFARRAGRSPSS